MIEQQIQEFNSLFPSYALGCLSRDDLDKMLFFMEQSAELDMSVLADYQRLSALLTIVIEPKEPAPKLKKKIAKKLYELTKNDIAESIDVPKKSAEIITEVEKPKSATQIVEDSTQSLDLADDDFINQTLQKLNNKSEVLTSTPTPNDNEITISETPQSQADIDKLFGVDNNLVSDIPIPTPDKSEFIVEYNDPVDLDNLETEKPNIPPHNTITYPEEKIPKKSKDSTSVFESKFRGIRWIDITFAGLLLLVLVGVFLTYSSFKSDIGLITEKMNSLSETNTNDFQKALSDVQHYLYNRKVLDNVIKSRDMMYIPLFGNPRNPNGYGRFLFDQNIRVGILFLSELPKIESDKVYRFWLSDGDTLLSTDMKQSEMGKQFYEVVDLPVINKKKEISIFVTEEIIGSSSNSISSKVYYSGKIETTN